MKFQLAVLSLFVLLKESRGGDAAANIAKLKKDEEDM